MTEKEIRSKVVEIAKGWLGCKESDGSHKRLLILITLVSHSLEVML